MDWFYVNGTNFAYDELNRVTMGEQGISWVFARSWYQYDKAGRETATWRDEQSSKGEKFWYTANNQLSAIQYNADQVWTSTPQNPGRSVGYTYTPDMLNRQSVNDNGTVSAYTPSGLNQYTDVGGNQLSYDDNFNQTGYGAQTTSFNAANQLISVSNPASGHSASFVYDGLGRCVRRTIDGVPRLFTYDEWNAVMEWDQGGSSVAVNIYGAKADEILARADATQGWSWLIYKQDKQGNVVALLDQSGNIAEKYTYDAFGVPTITDGNGNARSQSAYENRFMFTGREYLTELGLYDYRHRMYHPGLGRFLQTDPTGFDAGDMNLFRYCADDPVDRSDPMGLYARGDDFKDDRAWRRFKEAQKVEANRIENRLAHMNKENFEAEFGKGSATAANMTRIRDILKGDLTALRDDGRLGYVAHIAQRDLDSGVLAKGVPKGKDIYVHIENPFYKMPSRLEHAIGHEGVHNVGITGHGMLNGVTAYKYGNEKEKAAFKNLPSEERLRNADHIIEYAQ